MADLNKTHNKKIEYLYFEGKLEDTISYLEGFLSKGTEHQITEQYGYYDGERNFFQIEYWAPKTAEELEKERIAEAKRKAKWEADRPKREAKAAKEKEARKKIAEKQLKKLAKELGVKLP